MRFESVRYSLDGSISERVSENTLVTLIKVGAIARAVDKLVLISEEFLPINYYNRRSWLESVTILKKRELR
jgi:hypothetical protein